MVMSTPAVILLVRNEPAQGYFGSILLITSQKDKNKISELNLITQLELLHLRELPPNYSHFRKKFHQTKQSYSILFYLRDNT